MIFSFTCCLFLAHTIKNGTRELFSGVATKNESLSLNKIEAGESDFKVVSARMKQNWLGVS